MHLRAPAILCASRAHGETAAVIRMLTADHGLIAAYCAGARGRRLRPVVIPGNLLDVEISGRSASQLPFAKVELVESRGPWLGEPLASAAIAWSCALTATVLPEGHPYPALYQALGGLLAAICHAPSARGWSRALAAYEALLLRELGYGGRALAGGGGDPGDDWEAILDRLQLLGNLLETRLFEERGLAGRGGDVMAARSILIDRLKRIAGPE
ncbi:DNA repair protein RecO [Novosphingobium sp. Gsoil 351]|uniref:DNA repair protein RecO n=1 Tax=Novosphingobium sp. Gsoil 351 TaxID=2675225 RepID=UPI0012B4C4E9|nr:recombination protein O N-terminal domain-containing protein [Novosphingobium sp. Gsoil 351]QGN55928.1 DNA recombination protein RecO [Novosphingobium sp. Gsoil 351]